jgi:hypothetical protein
MIRHAAREARVLKLTHQNLLITVLNPLESSVLKKGQFDICISGVTPPEGNTILKRKEESFYDFLNPGMKFSSYERCFFYLQI